MEKENDRSLTAKEFIALRRHKFVEAPRAYVYAPMTIHYLANIFIIFSALMGANIIVFALEKVVFYFKFASRLQRIFKKLA